MISRLIILFLLLSGYMPHAISQNIGLAMNYVEQGEYEKAKAIYTSLYKTNPRKQEYVLGLSKVHVQLDEFEDARKLIKSYLDGKGNYPNMFIELGHIYTVERDSANANIWYDKAIDKVRDNVGYAYTVGRTFQSYSLLDYAITTYEIANAQKPQVNYRIQLARLYGEQGNIEKMFENYIELMENNDKYVEVIQRNFDAYISEDPDNPNNIILKRLLFSKLQKSPDLSYNQILSWLFVQEEEFKKAFAQEKAIYKRNTIPDFSRFFDLAQVMTEAEQYEEATAVYLYVKEESSNIDTQLKAVLKLMDVKILMKEDFNTIEQSFKDYLNAYGYSAQTLYLQLKFADFLAFEHNNVEAANAILQATLSYNLSTFQKAEVDVLSADILVAEQQFNQALVKYSLASKMVKNTPLAQEANFKTALTSYYKGDFDWALTQLKVLKQATTQTIANDALEMTLFIKQGKADTDSTQMALRRVAKADLLTYQGNLLPAIDELNRVLDVVENYHIKDQVFFKLGQLYEQLEDYPLAISSYTSLLTEYPQSIVIDNTLFAMALIYNEKLQDPIKAKEYLEQLIFEHEDSIFFVEARKLYRQLRGDQNL